MESAQDIVTGETVDADQLPALDVVDKTRYICRGCGVKVFPAAYHQDSQVRPYFRVQQGGGHLRGCDVDGEQVLIERGRVERLSTPSGSFPTPYPSALRLIEERPIVSETLPPTRQVGSAVVEQVEPTHRTMSYSTRRVANTIRPICRTYINFPFDRGSRPSIDALHR
jgi:hypothetical protein